MAEVNRAATAEFVEPVEEQPPSRWKRLWQGFLKRIWYVHPGAHLRLTIAPAQTFAILLTAAKPNINRLHLRDVFARGRRYFLYPREDGSFRMLTTHRVIWYPRRRSSASTVLNGAFEKIDDTTTRLTLRSRIQVLYLLDTLLWPTFITSMLIFMAWPLWLVIGCIVALYWLSWLVHRYTAALEAYEMIFFIEKALEEFISEPLLPLPPPSAAGDLVMERDFAEVWDKFVEERQED